MATTLFAYLLVSLLPQHDVPHPVDLTQDAILDAICGVETRGGILVSDGDGGRSIGPFQIQYSYWKDATEFDASLGGEYEDCRRRSYAERVVRAYMLRHVPDAWHELDAEVIARTHNGGPRGASRSATLRYWEKVAHLLGQSPVGRGQPPGTGRP